MAYLVLNLSTSVGLRLLLLLDMEHMLNTISRFLVELALGLVSEDEDYVYDRHSNAVYLLLEVNSGCFFLITL